MQARKRNEPAPTPIQLSLRIRHPAIEPEKITASLGLESEYCFKAGDSRRPGTPGRSTGQHTQTYWLAPITDESWDDPIDPQELPAAAGNLRSRSVEGLLLHFLQRLNARHSFLQMIQAGGGDVSLIMVIERESAADFTLPVTLTRLFVQLGISIEVKFDS